MHYDSSAVVDLVPQGMSVYTKHKPLLSKAHFL